MCMPHGHELRGVNVGGRGCAGQRGIKGGNGTTVIAKSIKYIFLKELTMNNYMPRNLKT